ncbi:MAG: hypothetical protein HY851_06645 [candidate division Zixibacteria bacterium]|nr:hypothetical protein [candidate division Zixibacteria bacterium]
MAGKTPARKKGAPLAPGTDFSIEGMPEDLTLMDELIRRYYQELLKSINENVKVGDFIKMIEFRRKLAPADSSQKKFWAMLDNVRKEALGGEKGTIQKSSAGRRSESQCSRVEKSDKSVCTT